MGVGSPWETEMQTLAGMPSSSLMWFLVLIRKGLKGVRRWSLTCEAENIRKDGTRTGIDSGLLSLRRQGH